MATRPPSATDQLLALAKAYQAAYDCDPGTANTAILKAHPDLVRQQRWERLLPGQAMPVEKAAPLSYEDILTTVAVRKTLDHSSTQEAFLKLLDAHAPRHPEWAEAYRHWQTHEQPQELAQANVDACGPLPPLTRAEMRKMVQAMPDPPAQPTMDFLKMRGG